MFWGLRLAQLHRDALPEQTPQVIACLGRKQIGIATIAGQLQMQRVLLSKHAQEWH